MYALSLSHTNTHTHHSRLVFLLPAQCGTGHQLGPPQMLLNLRVDGLSSLLIKGLICHVEARALGYYFSSLQPISFGTFTPYKKKVQTRTKKGFFVLSPQNNHILFVGKGPLGFYPESLHLLRLLIRTHPEVSTENLLTF